MDTVPTCVTCEQPAEIAVVYTIIERQSGPEIYQYRCERCSWDSLVAHPGWCLTCRLIEGRCEAAELGWKRLREARTANA